MTNERGEVRAAMGDKFRQINKFVETVAGLHASSTLAARRSLSVVDMGAGKGYLTFAVYDYLNNALGLEARVTGVEAREELVALCNCVAAEAGFERLQFRRGYIGDFSTDEEGADILIALHACDTATDEALFKGISSGASVIICAPCCHKEVRPQIEAPEVLRAVLRHGILLERQAEMLTDSMRALLLEYSGYTTKVFEFISTEHTAKNVMLTAVRRPSPTTNETALGQFRQLKEFYSVRTQRLERLLFDTRAALAEPSAPACDPV
ncbi:MAG TPA: SAM-dependent methyltransferase [Pyrinomonadaceae bacterium]